MLHTRICDLLGIEYPIISAPMGGGNGAAPGAANTHPFHMETSSGFCKQ